MHDSLLYIVPKWPLIAVAAVATLTTQPVKDTPPERLEEVKLAGPPAMAIPNEEPYQGFEEVLNTFMQVNKRNMKLIPELCEMYSISKEDCEAYMQRVLEDADEN